MRAIARFFERFFLVGLIVCFSHMACAEGDGDLAHVEGFWSAATNGIPLRVKARPEIRSAYHSRGRILESRPVATFTGRADFDFGPYGYLGAGVWEISSFTDQMQSSHRRMWQEVDPEIHYGYAWAFNEEWKLRSEAVRCWVMLPGYKNNTDHTTLEWRFMQSLDNPYVTPFYLMRRSTHPRDWTYWRTGLRKTIALPWDFSFTPSIYGELGDNRHFIRRYGKNPGGNPDYHSGLMTICEAFTLAWAYSKNLSFFVGMEQFDIVNDDARRNVKARKSPEARRDLAIFAAGAMISF